MKNEKRVQPVWQILWLVCGACSFGLAFLNPYVGWFAVGNLVLYVCGFYVRHIAVDRTKRLLNNTRVIRKMNRHQKEQFIKMDRQECKNIQAMANMMMPVLTAANAALNIYTWYYYSKEASFVTPLTFTEGFGSSICITLLIFDVLFALLFYFGLRINVDQIMKLPEVPAR